MGYKPKKSDLDGRFLLLKLLESALICLSKLLIVRISYTLYNSLSKDDNERVLIIPSRTPQTFLAIFFASFASFDL